ncbi:hypothetical protein ACIBEJ_48750 [Nonomuraea sp. NPDC050790]|uniref:hypothetical protein n=1 Tax=Nonomuraea sp. NPDC050790 TaxID=3364371 RepID=UPI00378A930D
MLNFKAEFDVGDIVAGVALLLSLWALLRPLLQRRKANFEVRYECLYGTREGYSWRVILVNHGPGAARKVKAASLEPTQEWDQIARIHAGQSFPLLWDPSSGGAPDRTSVEIRWRDWRLREQRETFHVGKLILI